jgi:FkbM family methyltransferase
VVSGNRLPRGRLRACLRNIGVRGFYPRHIIDGGANVGLWSATAHAVFPKASLTLVEPLAEMKPHLDKFCARTPNARWIHAGLAAENGVLPFAVTGRTDSTFTLSEEAARACGAEVRSVDVLTIDHLAEEVIGSVPEVIKLDLEGFEFEALEGATRCLGVTELFFMEVPLWSEFRDGTKIFREAVQAMGDYGYEVYDFAKYQLRKHDRALGQADVVFARRDGFLRAHKGWF